MFTPITTPPHPTTPPRPRKRDFDAMSPSEKENFLTPPKLQRSPLVPVELTLAATHYASRPAGWSDLMTRSFFFPTLCEYLTGETYTNLDRRFQLYHGLLSDILGNKLCMYLLHHVLLLLRMDRSMPTPRASRG